MHPADAGVAEAEGNWWKLQDGPPSEECRTLCSLSPFTLGKRVQSQHYSSSELGLIQVTPGEGHNPGPITCWSPEGGMLPGRPNQTTKAATLAVALLAPRGSPVPGAGRQPIGTTELWHPEATSKRRGGAGVSPNLPSILSPHSLLENEVHSASQHLIARDLT